MPEQRATGDRDGRLRLPDGHSAAELHAHTLASDGMVSPEDLVAAAAEAGVAVLAVTDHDTTGGYERAAEAGEAHGVGVIRGEEVTTAFPANTHVIGLYLDRPIRMGMSIEDTVDAIHDQGGLAVLPHPFMPTYFASISARRAARLLEHCGVDGIELRHTSVMTPWGWRSLDDFYAEHRERLGAALGASDTHFGRCDLGRILTVFPGRTAEDLRAAIATRTTSPLAALRPEPPSLMARLAQQRRSLLWLSRERWAGRVGGGDGPARRREDG